jgi:hypothetical protein
LSCQYFIEYYEKVVADGGGEWRIGANILNKQPRQPIRGGPAAWGLGEVLTIPHLKIPACYEMLKILLKKQCSPWS